MGQVGLLEGPPAGTGRPGDQSNLGFPGATRKGGFLAWPSWQWIFWLARWVSGLAHLPGICLPEALSCSNSHLGLGLLLRPGPGRVLPAGAYLALGFSARPDLAKNSPWPSFPFLRLSGPGLCSKKKVGGKAFLLTFHPWSITISSPSVGSGSSLSLAQGPRRLLRCIVSLSFSPKSSASVDELSNQS